MDHRIETNNLRVDQIETEIMRIHDRKVKCEFLFNIITFTIL